MERDLVAAGDNQIRDSVDLNGIGQVVHHQGHGNIDDLLAALVPDPEIELQGHGAIDRGCIEGRVARVAIGQHEGGGRP